MWWVVALAALAAAAVAVAAAAAVLLLLLVVVVCCWCWWSSYTIDAMQEAFDVVAEHAALNPSDAAASGLRRTQRRRLKEVVTKVVDPFNGRYTKVGRSVGGGPCVSVVVSCDGLVAQLRLVVDSREHRAHPPACVCVCASSTFPAAPRSCLKALCLPSGVPHSLPDHCAPSLAWQCAQEKVLTASALDSATVVRLCRVYLSDYCCFGLEMPPACLEAASAAAGEWLADTDAVCRRAGGLEHQWARSEPPPAGAAAAAAGTAMGSNDFFDPLPEPAHAPHMYAGATAVVQSYQWFLTKLAH